MTTRSRPALEPACVRPSTTLSTFEISACNLRPTMTCLSLRGGKTVSWCRPIPISAPFWPCAVSASLACALQARRRPAPGGSARALDRQPGGVRQRSGGGKRGRHRAVKDPHQAAADRGMGSGAWGRMTLPAIPHPRSRRGRDHLRSRGSARGRLFGACAECSHLLRGRRPGRPADASPGRCALPFR